MNEIIGWASSAIMVLTIMKQVHTQWKEGKSDGVSIWLYLGQITCSAGFVLYSWLLHNIVFLVANCCSLISATVGVFVMRRNQAQPSKQRRLNLRTMYV